MSVRQKMYRVPKYRDEEWWFFQDCFYDLILKFKYVGILNRKLTTKPFQPCVAQFYHELLITVEQ